MNLNALHKNYDKLTVKERFAALIAAGLREDKQEQTALVQSAPRKTFTIREPYGLSTAFEWLSMLQRIFQLEDAGLMLLLTAIDAPEESEAKPEEISKAFDMAAERYQTSAAAWAALCKEYGIAPNAFSNELPEDGVLSWADRLADLIGDGQDAQKLQERLDDFRQVIETKANLWT